MEKRNAIGSVWLSALNWEEAAEALPRLPAVLPVGGSAIEHGPHLPYDTDRPIAELALAAGYADQNALTRAMRRATGSTPAAIRRAARDAA